MSNYLMINGKRIDLTEEQVKILTEDEKDIWRKPEDGETYFTENVFGEIIPYVWEEDKGDEEIYKNANCCLKKEPLKKERLEIILYRRLYRFSCQHGWDESVWGDANKKKWYMWYDCRHKTWNIDWSNDYKVPMMVFFMSQEIAKKAMQDIITPFCDEFPEYMKVD